MELSDEVLNAAPDKGLVEKWKEFYMLNKILLGDITEEEYMRRRRAYIKPLKNTATPQAKPETEPDAELVEQWKEFYMLNKSLLGDITEEEYLQQRRAYINALKNTAKPQAKPETDPFQYHHEWQQAYKIALLRKELAEAEYKNCIIQHPQDHVAQDYHIEDLHKASRALVALERKGQFWKTQTPFSTEAEQLKAEQLKAEQLKAEQQKAKATFVSEENFVPPYKVYLENMCTTANCSGVCGYNHTQIGVNIPFTRDWFLPPHKSLPGSYCHNDLPWMNMRCTKAKCMYNHAVGRSKWFFFHVKGGFK